MANKDAVRRIRGAISRAKGERFEERMDAAFQWYADIGFATIEKTPEPMRVIRPLGNGQFVAVFRKKAQPDYKGTIKGGLSVVLEAKFTDHDRMEQSRVMDEQTKKLNAHQKLGARCFVVAGFGTGGVYCIPWAVWRDMKNRFGRKYVTEADLTRYCVPVGNNGILKIFE